MATLYELTGDYQRLLEMAEDTEIDADAFRDTLEGLDGEIEIKADGYAKVIKQIESETDGLAKEIQRLTDRKKSLDSRITAMKQSLQAAMEITGKTKFKTQLFSFGVQNNPPSLKIDDESKIPLEYWIPQPATVDKETIKQMLKDGEKLEYAHLEQGRSLRIR